MYCGNGSVNLREVSINFHYCSTNFDSGAMDGNSGAVNFEELSVDFDSGATKSKRCACYVSTAHAW